MALLKIAWRSIWRNKRRTLITVSAIGFALTVTVFFIAFAEGVYDQLIHDAVRMRSGHVTLEHPDYRKAPAIDLVVDDAWSLRRKLGDLPEVASTKALIQGQGVLRSGYDSVGVALSGVEPEVERESSPLADRIVAGSYLAESDDNRAVIGGTLAERLEVEVGDKMVIMSNDPEGNIVQRLVRVRGVFSTGTPEIDGYMVQVPLGFAQDLYGLEDDQVTQLGLVLDDPGDQDEVIARAREMTGGRTAAVLPWQEVMKEMATYIEIDGGSNIVLQSILIFLSLFTIFNTILMSVMERTREFAVMLALGTLVRRVRGQIVVESVYIGALGCAVGLTAGGLLSYWFEVHGLDLRSFYAGDISVSGMSVEPVMHANVTPGILVTLGTVVFVATIVSSLIALRRISRIDLASVLR
jgi:ABC-type lipoprotein release transport system permease subunit